MKSMSHQQRLFQIESTQLLEALHVAKSDLNNYRGGMKWIKSGGFEYLVKLSDSKGNGKSLGKRSEATETIFQSFLKNREACKIRYDALATKLKEQARLNKAVGLGRVPSTIAKILSAMLESKIAFDFRVIGTHALYAYETQSGVFFETSLLASGDVDLLYDPRKKLSLVIDKLDGNGLIGLLRNVDKTFSPVKQGGFRAVNNEGFMVDLITPIQGMKQNPITFSENDLVASEVPGLQWLCNAPAIQSTVISESGMPLIMNVPDPRAFAIHKSWLSMQKEREPVKRSRDKAQSVMLLEMIREHMPLFPFREDHMKYLPKELLSILGS
jgi:hypothetical protein